MTLVVEAQRVFHDVQTHHVTDGGDAMYVRTHCGHYLKESVFTLEPKPGVPTCLDCIVGRVRWEHALRVFADAGGGDQTAFRAYTERTGLLTARPLLR